MRHKNSRIHGFGWNRVFFHFCADHQGLSLTLLASAVGCIFTSPNSDHASIFLLWRCYFTQYLTAYFFYINEFLILFSAEICNLHMSWWAQLQSRRTEPDISHVPQYTPTARFSRTYQPLLKWEFNITKMQIFTCKQRITFLTPVFLPNPKYSCVSILMK